MVEKKRNNDDDDVDDDDDDRHPFFFYPTIAFDRFIQTRYRMVMREFLDDHFFSSSRRQ